MCLFLVIFCCVELGIEWIPIVKDWRLNERHYGALVGRNKKKCVEEYGKGTHTPTPYTNPMKTLY